MTALFADTSYCLAFLSPADDRTGDHHFQQAGFTILLK